MISVPDPSRMQGIFSRLLIAVVLLPAPHAQAGPSGRASSCRTRCQDASCLITAGRCLLESGEARQARDLLKRARAQHPGHAELDLLLARAYWEMGNRVWARRVLLNARMTRPGDCQVRSWLIWLHLQQAELEQAEGLLGERGCPQEGAMRGRWRLLRATLARFRRDPRGAREHVEQVHEMGTLYEDDQDLLERLTAYALPRRPPPISLRVELGGGYSSNGLMSNPAAVTSLGEAARTGSPLMTLEMMIMMNPPWGRRVRPVLELGMRSLLLLGRSAVAEHSPLTPYDHSFVALHLRPGLALGSLRLYYAGQLFLLTGDDRYGDGPRWFYETHRGELEWEPLPWLTLWGGAGHSSFREQVRSRAELDGGGGLGGTVWRFRLLGGASLRKHWAPQHQLLDSRDVVRAYSLWGGSLISSATLPMSYLSLRVRFVISFDIHHDSAGYFKDKQGDPVPEDRRDLLLKGGGELWSPGWHGLRLGLSYEVSHRRSTVDAYDYVDHRGLLRLRWRLSLDPWKPGRAAAGPGHVHLPRGATRAVRLEDERIQDLLRQEDAARRGSSCIN